MLLCFQAVSSLKINLAKFELVQVGANRVDRDLGTILEYRSGNLHWKYKVFLLALKFKEILVWDPVMSRSESQLTSWKRILLSKRGVLTLIKMP